MLDEGNNINLETPEETPPPEESNNRTFLIVGGIFAGLIFLTLVCGAIYVLWLGPRLTSQRNAAQATIEAKNAQVVLQMTSTAEAALFTPTSLPTFTPTDTTVPTATIQVSSPTPVIAVSTVVATATSTTDPATLIAMQTQLSQQMTFTAVMQGASAATPVVGVMPKTGFFDQVVPSLVILALALIAVIFLARRLRKSPTK